MRTKEEILKKIGEYEDELDKLQGKSRRLEYSDEDGLLEQIFNNEIELEDRIDTLEWVLAEDRP